MTNKEKVLLLIADGKSNKEISEVVNISIRSIERYRKLYKDATTTNDKNDNTTTNDKKRKEKKEVAKALIISGESITEVSKRTGIPRGTIGNWSTQEKLQKKQLEHLKEFRDQYRTRVQENKLRRLQANEEALHAIEYELSNWSENGKISKALMEKLVMNEQVEQLIFELDRIERLEKQDVTDTQEDKVSKFLEALEKGLDA